MHECPLQIIFWQSRQFTNTVAGVCKQLFTHGNLSFVGAVSDDYPGGQRDLGTGWVLWLEPGVPTTTKEVTHSEEPAVIPVSRNETLASGQETHIKTPSNNIILYPNPSEGRVELLFKDAIKAEVKVEVVTLLGQVTYTREETLNNEQGLQLELSTLAAGQYLVKVTFGQEQFVKMLNLTK